MAKRHITDDELTLLQAIVAAGIANEDQLAAVLGLKPRTTKFRFISGAQFEGRRWLLPAMPKSLQ